MRIRAFVVLALATLAGPALAGSTMAPSGDRPDSGDVQVVAHHESGQAAPARLHPRVQVIPTSFDSGEPTVGFDSAGTAWFVGFRADDATGALASGLYTVGANGTGLRDRSQRVQGQFSLLSQDPYLYSDPKTGRVFDVQLQPPCSRVRYTDDRGATWHSSLAGCSLADHQTVFAGPAPEGAAAPTGYPNVVYYCAITDGIASSSSAGIGCERSLDGGTTWVNTGGQPFTLDPARCAGLYLLAEGCDGVGGNGVVAPDGTVLVPKVFDGVPMLAHSRDEGLTWDRVVVNPQRASTDESGYSDGQSSVAVDAAGIVYYAWMGRDRQPQLAISRDGGRHFAKPQSIGIPGLHQAWHVAIDAAGRGRVAVHYIGSTDAPSAPFPDDSACRGRDLVDDAQKGISCTYTPDEDYRSATWNAYLGITTDALAANPTWYSARANPADDPLVIGECLGLRCQQEYDFTDVHISPYDGSAWAVYVDGCNSSNYCTALGRAQVARMSGVDLR